MNNIILYAGSIATTLIFLVGLFEVSFFFINKIIDIVGKFVSRFCKDKNKEHNKMTGND